MVQATARSTFLLPISPALRLLHRAVLRQFEQAALTLSLVKVLHEQFIQRGRDKSNDTLYLLTVVTTIVTPLQIMAGGQHGLTQAHTRTLTHAHACTGRDRSIDCCRSSLMMVMVRCCCCRCHRIVGCHCADPCRLPLCSALSRVTVFIFCRFPSVRHEFR
jgi:hypothetical protein